MAADPTTIACTIVSKNYLHYARTLMASVKAAHPDWGRVVLLVDRIDGRFDPAAEDFEVRVIEDLRIPDIRRFCFQYEITELNTAAKPWLLEDLLKRPAVKAALYIDPDIYIYRPLTHVVDALNTGTSIVLTPHLTAPLNDGRMPGEPEIMKSGAYNLGFVAMGRVQASLDMLRWWAGHSLREFRIDIPNHQFTDQRWIDLVPGMFADVCILRHPGYNTAYWNLAHRDVTRASDGYLANGDTLHFFHFSGLNPGKPEAFSKHQDRYSLSTVTPAVREMVRDYCERTRSAGFAETAKWPYAFGYFNDGTPIPSAARTLLFTNSRVSDRAGDDPFSVPDVFDGPVSGGGHGVVSDLMLQIWSDRPELQQMHPDPLHVDAIPFAKWFVEFGSTEIPMPPSYRTRAAERLTAASERGDTPRGPGRFSRVRSRLFMALRPYRGLVPLRLRRYVRKKLLGDGLVRLTGTAPRTAGTTANDRRGEKALALNVYGNIRAQTGVGQAVRAMLQSAEAAEISTVAFDVSPWLTGDSSFEKRLGEPDPRSPSLVQVNADHFAIANAESGGFRGTYIIGSWYWELGSFPTSWRTAFDLVDELWAPSRFIQGALEVESPVPVVYMPPAISMPSFERRTRAELGLPDDGFLFLCMYDMRSVQARKNPEAAIESFHRAFPSGGEARLVIKVMNGNEAPKDLARVRELAVSNPAVTVIDRVMTRDDVYALESAVDSFVSLHRSEGFGLGLAECMLLGKPVIATNWSGNVDFMPDDTVACPVNYRLVELECDHGPYKQGNVWADPDIDHAASHMKRLVADAALASRIGTAGREYVAAHFSPAVVGARMRERLGAIVRRLDRLNRQT